MIDTIVIILFTVCVLGAAFVFMPARPVRDLPPPAPLVLHVVPIRLRACACDGRIVIDERGHRVPCVGGCVYRAPVGVSVETTADGRVRWARRAA